MRRSLIGLLGDIKNEKWRKIWPFILFVLIAGTVFLYIFQTTEYARFTSDIDEIDFTLEYPQRSWEEPTITESDEKYIVNIQGPFLLSAGVYMVSISPTQSDARAILDDYIEQYSNEPNFYIYSNSVLTDGFFSGPRAVLRYGVMDESGSDEEYIPSQAFIWIILHNGKLYEIKVSGSRKVLDEMWKEQARFIDSFRILD